MRLTVIGCSGSFAGPGSPASSYLVRADDETGRTWHLLLDLGNGALGALQRQIDLADLDAIAISHLHPDHCADLLGLYVARKYDPAGRTPDPLPVYGPTSTPERLRRSYEGIEEPAFAGQFAFSAVADKESFTVGPMHVTPYRVNHPVEAYGFRVEADGAVLAFTGDTDSTPNLTPLLTGANLALLDSAFVDGRDETRDIHLTGSRAAQACLDAGGVRRIMLTHIPVWNDPEECRAQAAAVWPGEVELARPGRTYTLGEPPRSHPVLNQAALDTTDARGLAEFYRELLGLRYLPGDEPPVDGSEDDPGWLVLTDHGGGRVLAVQQVETLTRTTWPSHEVPMQVHLDYTVTTVEELEHHRVRAESLGATVLLDRADDEGEPLYVLADPAGHPFCLFVA
jgi:ribonuclease BN (tRNA processing enzyme)